MVLIGVSGEAESVLADHVTAKGIQYPIVQSPSAGGAYGIRFYPSYFLIAADGTVVTLPADRKPDHELIERELRHVVLTPKLPDDPYFAPLRRAWEKPDFARIDGFLTKALADQELAPERRAVVEAQRADLDARLAAVERRIAALANGPDYHAATTKLEKLASDWSGMPIADRAEELLEHFKKDAAIKREVGASRTLERLLQRFDRTRIAQRRKLVDALIDFERRFAGTHAAKQSQTIRVGLAG